MAARPLTTTGFIILGLLSSRDWSAYELAEQVGRGVDQLWPRADRQRYNTPKTLLAQGLVTARTEAKGRRTRTVYSITEAGRVELAAWLATTSKPPALEFEAMVKVLIASDGTIADLRATLELIEVQAAEARALFAAHAAFIAATGGTFPERKHLFAMVNRFMIGHYDHVIEWAAVGPRRDLHLAGDLGCGRRRRARRRHARPRAGGLGGHPGHHRRDLRPRGQLPAHPGRRLACSTHDTTCASSISSPSWTWR